MAYGAITARYFNAQYHCICKSGIGLMVSWFPIIMPELYYRLDASDPSSKWNFSTYTPDIVVINLGQNDSGVILRPTNKQFQARFGNEAPGEEQIIKAYRDFIGTIRKHYPKAKIVCALGSMDVTKEGSPWPGYVEKAVNGMHDKDISFLIFPFINSTEHPNAQQHQAMAGQLIEFIEKNLGW
jgi:lysophospholipase L1-like esterase